MSTDVKLQMARARYKRLYGTTKNIKCPGVLRKVARSIRNLEKQI